MKTIVKSSLIILTFFILVACSNDESTNDIVPSQKITNTNLAKTLNYQNAVSLKGKFKYFKNSDDQIIIYTETTHQKHIFNIKGIKNFNFTGNIDVIAYLKDGILINNEIFIGVNGNVTDQLMKDVNEISKNNIKENITINTLTYLWISKDNILNEGLAFTSPNLERHLDEIINIDALQEGKCDHGGEGSTGCSVNGSGGDTGCSVSCGSGYYACCVKGTDSVTQSCHCDKA